MHPFKYNAMYNFLCYILYSYNFFMEYYSNIFTPYLFLSFKLIKFIKLRVQYCIALH